MLLRLLHAEVSIQDPDSGGVRTTSGQFLLVNLSHAPYSVPVSASTNYSMPRFEAQPRASAGLSNRQIQQIRLIPYEKAPSEESDCCAICLTEFEDGESLRTLWCSHKFHPTCIDTWLTERTKCPLCQQSVLQEGQQGEPVFSPTLIPSNAVEMTTMHARIRTGGGSMREGSRTGASSGNYPPGSEQHVSVIEVAPSEPPQPPPSLQSAASPPVSQREAGDIRTERLRVTVAQAPQQMAAPAAARRLPPLQHHGSRADRGQTQDQSSENRPATDMGNWSGTL